MKSLVLFVILCVSVSTIASIQMNSNKIYPQFNDNDMQILNNNNNLKITDQEENEYNNQINSFLSEIDNSNKFIMPDSTTIHNFDPDLLLRISFPQNGEVEGIFKYSNNHVEFKPNDPDSFIISKLNDNKFSQYEFYKAVLSLNPRHFSNEFKNEVELSLVFRYNQRFFYFDNGKIRKKKYLIVSLPYAVKRLFSKVEEPKKEFLNLRNGILNSYYENYYVHARNNFNYESLLKRLRKSKSEDQGETLDYTLDGIPNITLFEHQNKTDSNETGELDRLKFYKDQFEKLTALRNYRNFNFSDNLLKDFLFDFESNNSSFIKQDIMNTTNSTNVEKNNLTDTYFDKANQPLPEIAISVSVNRNNYDQINDKFSSTVKKHSSNKNRYSFVSSNDNEKNFYFNEANEKEIKMRKGMEITKNGTMKFKKILESFKKDLLYFEEPNLDDYSYILSSKNIDLTEASSVIKIAISNFVFVENNFISEEFFNFYNQTLIQLKIKEQDNNALISNINGIQNNTETNNKVTGIKRFISFIDENILYEINDFINDFKFINTQDNSVFPDDANKNNINWIRIEPNYIKKNFIKHIQIKENENYIDHEPNQNKDLKHIKNSEVSYSIRSFENFIQNSYPDYYSKFLGLKIFIKNYIISDIVKKPELADLKDESEIVEKFAKIFEIFFKMIYKTKKKVGKTENNETQNHDNPAEAHLKDMKNLKNVLLDKNEISGNFLSRTGKKLSNKPRYITVNDGNFKNEKIEENEVIAKVYDENNNPIPLDLIKNHQGNLKKELIGNKISINHNQSENPIRSEISIQIGDDLVYNNNENIPNPKNSTIPIAKSKGKGKKISEEKNSKTFNTPKTIREKLKRPFLDYKIDDSDEELTSNIPKKISKKGEKFDDLKLASINSTSTANIKNNTKPMKPFFKHQKIKYLNGTFVIIDTMMLPSEILNLKLAKEKFKEIIDSQ